MSEATISTLYLEDLAVGMTFRNGPIEITREEILAFARQFDPQPFHLDDAAAAGTIFRGLAASGWHTSALTMKLLTSGGAPFGGGVVSTGGVIEWPRPTRAGDILSTESEILEIIPSKTRPDRARMRVRTTTTNQKGEAVMVFTAELLAMSRGAGAS